MERWSNTRTNRFNMIHAIVGAVAAGCVVSGFVIGFGLIIESIHNSRKSRGR
jgi:hypothetical protein